MTKAPEDTAMTEEAYFRFNSLRSDVLEDADGVEVRFVCCGARARFAAQADPGEIGERIIAHACETARPRVNFVGDPVAKTMADLVTPKQLVAIRAIANTQGVNAEAACMEMLRCRPEELSRRAASAFIDYLKTTDLRAHVDPDGASGSVRRGKSMLDPNALCDDCEEPRRLHSPEPPHKSSKPECNGFYRFVSSELIRVTDPH